MWISSFVVALPFQSVLADRICDAIASIPVLQPGQRFGGRLPVVLEVERGTDARYWFDWVSALPGVIKVDLAFVSFDEADSERNGDGEKDGDGDERGRGNELNIAQAGSKGFGNNE